MFTKKKEKSKAAFVPTESGKTDRFKYILNYSFSKYVSKKIISFKDIVIKSKQWVQLWMSKVEWITLRSDLFVWIVEVSVEGLTANFATHFLFGMPFTIWTVLAHGIFIQQMISIYWRLRNNGEHSKIPKKNN